MTTDQIKALPVLEIDPRTVMQGDRIRTDLDLTELQESMLDPQVGQIVPIILDINHRLIDGGRRLTVALKNNWTTIRYVYREVLSDTHLRILEVEANKHKRFNWRENCIAVDRVHSGYSLDAALKGEGWTLKETGKLLGTTASPVHYAVLVAARLKAEDPEILKCDSLNDALKVLMSRKEAEANALLVRLSMPKDGGLSQLTADLSTAKKPRFNPGSPKSVSPAEADQFFADADGYEAGISGPEGTDEVPGGPRAVTTIPLSQMLLKEEDHNSLGRFSSLGLASLDHIITDPPYGIDLDMISQRKDRLSSVDNTRIEHDEEDNFSMLRRFIPLAYDRLKPGGFCIMFCDYMMYQTLYDWGTAAGFGVQRWPLVWHKTHSCLNQAAQTNFTKNHEPAIVMRKGTATLLAPQSSSVFSASNDAEARALGHPFSKPFALWSWLYKSSALQGSTVCDPFAGRGSSTLAAIQCGLRPLAIECSGEHYNHLIINVQNQYRALDPTCLFS